MTANRIVLLVLISVLATQAAAAAQGGPPTVKSVRPLALGESAEPTSAGQPHNSDSTQNKASETALSTDASADTKPAATEPASAQKYRELEERSIGGAPADGAATGGDQPGSVGGFGGSWIALAVVLGLIIVGAWTIRRWAPAASGIGRRGPIQVLARGTLSPKQFVALIRVGERMLVVGVTGQQISLLSEIDDEQEVANLSADLGSGKSLLKEGFDSLLGRQQNEMAEPDERDDSTVQRAQAMLGDLLGRVRSRLARMKAS